MNPPSTNRFRLLATHIAGRAVEVVQAPAGQAPYTDGRTIFVSAGGTEDQQRREMLVQSALLGAGSLDACFVKHLRARPSSARRYLSVEGHRVVRGLAERVTVAADLGAAQNPITTSAAESLELARGRTRVVDPPQWFGVIRPSRLLTSSARHQAGDLPSDQQLRLHSGVVESTDEDMQDAEDNSDNARTAQASKILRLFENPLLNSQAMARFLRKLFGASGSSGDSTAGAEMPIGAIRRSEKLGINAKPVPAALRFTDDNHPGAAVGVAGALFPEWDVHQHRYRERWCRVVSFPQSRGTATASSNVRDEVLRQRLSRVGLGPKLLRARPDGDDLDIEALVNVMANLRAGHSPAEHVYCERRNLARQLGVLILLDASGSTTDTDPSGRAVHDHQRRAAATLAATLEELGDRVAVYAFRSQGRQSVHLLAIKTFGQRFGAVQRALLSQVQPFGYTRLGAGIRGAGEILRQQAGTPNRLLVVLSDGFPYDDGYEGHYAEADARKALEELRTQGVACLCLSLGGATAAQLSRVFGSAGHASAATLSDLSPKMDELFLTALRELAAPRSTNTTAGIHH